MLARVDIAGAEVGDQQLVTGEYIQWQEAMMIIIAVEEAFLLATVNTVVGGVEVEHQVLGWLGVSGNELINEHLSKADQRLAVHAVFKATESRR